MSVKPADIAAAGIERVSRVVGTRDGYGLLAGERVLPARNVIWCTGFGPDFSWIDLPVFGQDKKPNEPVHVRGIVADEPALYFVGLYFLYAMSSGFLPGVGRDAKHVVEQVASRPLLEPADWQGITFETFHSDGQTEAVRALGAIPMFPSRAGPDDDLDVGGVHALDKNLFIYALNGTTPRAPHVSANVNLWPETAALLVNPSLLSSLSPVQQGWLRRAYASETRLAALRPAVAPVYATLAHGPQTWAFIREIEDLKGSIDAETLDVPNGCIGPAPTRSTPPPNAPAELNGVYRVGLFSGDLVSLGMSPADARAAAGTRTLTLKNGRWNRRGIGLENSVECSGTYTVADRPIAFTVDRLPDCDWTYGRPVDAAWTVRGRDLILTDVHGDGLVPLVMGSRPWQRTSEPPSGTELRR